MTGMLRLSGCSLFIHGTGGGGSDDEHEGYDTVTEEWLREWLGAAELAPLAVVTATRRLPLGVSACPREAEVAAARWRTHSALHHPAMVGNQQAEETKAALVSEIKGSRDRSARAELFRSMHRFLDEYRVRCATRLEGLRRGAAEIEGQRADAAIASDRTWPFPLYPEGTLRSLKTEIDESFELS
jgi:hypothetical protein